MAIATELTINTAASAMDMAQAIFGSGVQVQTASFSGEIGANAASGIYSGAQTTIPGIVPGDSGVILSTGRVVNFTNSSGTTNTNTVANLSSDTAGVDGDAQLNAVAGRATFDGAILNATFIPDGDFLTMQFVFASDEYPEWVNSNFNDAFGVWVNGTFVPMTITSTGEVAINTVNNASNQNLYHDNTADQFNTEMDGFTRVLSFKAPVNSGQINTIKIGIADAGDTGYDSNLLISGNSIQTIALAFDDDVQLLANSSRTFDILANDNDQTDGGLTITHINDVPLVAGQTVTLQTGEQVRLNADGTVTVFSDGGLGSSNLNYAIIDSAGNTDTGFITITTVASLTRDGIIEGTAGNDVIQVGYLGDPDGDRVDNNDALGVGGTTGNGDFIQSGAGNDSIVAGNGNDVVYAGADNDTVFGGAGNDWVSLGAGNDSFGTFGTDSAGNDTVFGDAGNDYIIGGAGSDRLYGGAQNDTLSGGMGADSVYGGDGADAFMVTDDHEADLIDGGSGGTDTDTIFYANFLTTQGVNVTFTGAEAGTYGFVTTPSGFAPGSGSFTDIEAVALTDYADTVNGTANTQAMAVSGNGGADALTGGSAADSLFGGAGSDTLTGGDGADLIDAGGDNDTIFGGAGDVVLGGDGTDVLDLSAYRHSGTTVTYTDGDPATGSGTVDFLDGNGDVTGTLSFSSIESVVACFTPGSLILTETGEVPVERLSLSDRVLTRDNGFQAIRWMARRDLGGAELRANPAFHPVRIARGALGDGLPDRDLTVSPQHRMLLSGARAELLFGEREVLVAATQMVGMAGVTRVFPPQVSYIHFMCDAHEVVRTDGAWSESFQPGAQTVAGLGAAQRTELLSLFPDVLQAHSYTAARMTLKSREAAVLLRA